jgi:hypothetical protein
MLCPTIGYFTFYDIAIIGFWTACLLLLYHDRFLSYLALLSVATLNHENSLLLVPVAVLWGWRRMKLPRLALFAISQVALYVAVRYWVISLFPRDRLFDNRLWQNLVFWRSYNTLHLFCAWGILVPWWLIALMGWNYAPRLLKCSAISLPGLFVVATLFGQYTEARQFDAFIPTCIGLTACWFRHRWGAVPPLARSV